MTESEALAVVREKESSVKQAEAALSDACAALSAAREAWRAACIDADQALGAEARCMIDDRKAVITKRNHLHVWARLLGCRDPRAVRRFRLTRDGKSADEVVEGYRYNRPRLTFG